VAKIFFGLRSKWNFFIYKGTISLFHNIPGSIQLLDLSRFGVILWLVFTAGLRFFEAPFYITSDGLHLSLSVGKKTKQKRALGRTAFKSWGRSNPFSSSKFLLVKTALAAVSTTRFLAFSFLAFS